MSASATDAFKDEDWINQSNPCLKIRRIAKRLFPPPLRALCPQLSNVTTSPMAAATPPTLRSLYRSILRELPHRPLSTPSPLQQRIRSSFSTAPSASTSSEYDLLAAEQYVQYARAQRMYATLLERYNPGMGMDEEERVRLTARRVGMDLPEEWRKS